MEAIKKATNDSVLSYFLLRQLIGIIGIFLPFALLLGNRLLGNEFWLQQSISHYYYSYMHIGFIGVLIILGAFLITYREENNPLANRVSNFAGSFAFGVAAFPTSQEGFMGKQYIITTFWEPWFRIIHFGSAFLLFSCFAIFCFKIFQKSDSNAAPSQFDEKKKLRNKIYTFCGWGIIVSIAIIASGFIYEINNTPTTFTTYATFIFESTALLFFGNSWLLKGSVNWKNSSNVILNKMVKPVR